MCGVDTKALDGIWGYENMRIWEYENISFQFKSGKLNLEENNFRIIHFFKFSFESEKIILEENYLLNNFPFKFLFELGKMNSWRKYIYWIIFLSSFYLN